jgi:hypothetical protein
MSVAVTTEALVRSTPGVTTTALVPLAIVAMPTLLSNLTRPLLRRAYPVVA